MVYHNLFRGIGKLGYFQEITLRYGIIQVFNNICIYALNIWTDRLEQTMKN